MSLKLTRAQMQGPLRDDGRFADWYIENFMKTHLPQFYWSISPEGRREMVINGRRYARHFGFSDAMYQMQFITFMWTVGANFFMCEGFRQIATHPGLTEAQKIEAFYELDPDLATRAVMQPDDRYWYPEMVGLAEQLK